MVVHHLLKATIAATRVRAVEEPELVVCRQHSLVKQVHYNLMPRLKQASQRILVTKRLRLKLRVGTVD